MIFIPDVKEIRQLVHKLLDRQHADTRTLYTRSLSFRVQRRKQAKRILSNVIQWDFLRALVFLSSY